MSELHSDGPSDGPSDGLSDGPAIEIRDLEVRFRRCHPLRGVDLTIAPGTVFALLGENGAGKTTMIRAMTGYQRPTAGTIRIGGLDPAVDRLAIRRRVGYVSDSPAMYDWMRIDQIGSFTHPFYGGAFYDNYRSQIERYGLPPTRKIKQLSKGQRAKVALSLAIAHDPELLIMDEPTSGLDPMVRRDFLESMIDRAITGRTVFLSSHQINEVERVADTVAILHDGQIRVCGPLEEIKSSIRQWIITVDDPLTAIPPIAPEASIIAEETSGRQRRVVTRGVQTAGELASDDNVVSVTHQRLSLEEIFIVCTRGLDEPGDRSGLAAAASPREAPVQ